jgi:hypothetical protein
MGREDTGGSRTRGRRIKEVGEGRGGGGERGVRMRGLERNQLESKGLKKEDAPRKNGLIEKKERREEEVINGNEDCLAKCEWAASEDIDGRMDGWTGGCVWTDVGIGRRVASERNPNVFSCEAKPLSLSLSLSFFFLRSLSLFLPIG